MKVLLHKSLKFLYDAPLIHSDRTVTLMQQFLDFSLRHWELWLALFVILILLALLELRNKMSGFRGISPQETTFFINRETGVVIDIRDSDAFVKGHIASAINTPLNDLSNQLSRLEKHKDKTIIIVTNGTQTPGKAGIVLKDKGFSKIHYLNGGITAWQGAGLPLVKGK